MNLTKAEEQLMKYLWKLERAFMKDLLEQYPPPKPAPTTVATLLKRLHNKGFIDYEKFGSIRQYYATVNKKEYFSSHIKGLIKGFFNNSNAQFASFFTDEIDLSEEELQELRAIVDQKIQKKKK